MTGRDEPHIMDLKSERGHETPKSDRSLKTDATCAMVHYTVDAKTYAARTKLIMVYFRSVLSFRTVDHEQTLSFQLGQPSAR